MKAVVLRMIEHKRGSIVLISSVNAVIGNPGADRSDYGTAAMHFGILAAQGALPPETIANTAAWLASDGSYAVTGSEHRRGRRVHDLAGIQPGTGLNALNRSGPRSCSVEVVRSSAARCQTNGDCFGNRQIWRCRDVSEGSHWVRFAVVAGDVAGGSVGDHVSLSHITGAIGDRGGGTSPGVATDLFQDGDSVTRGAHDDNRGHEEGGHDHRSPNRTKIPLLAVQQVEHRERIVITPQPTRQERAVAPHLTSSCRPLIRCQLHRLRTEASERTKKRYELRAGLVGIFAGQGPICVSTKSVEVAGSIPRSLRPE